MLVNCFTVQVPTGSYKDIDELYDLFGDSGPQYLQLEGGDYQGPQYLFCVDAKIDVRKICEENGFRFFSYKPTTIEIDEKKYSRSYIVKPTYKSFPALPYCLVAFET